MDSLILKGEKGNAVFSGLIFNDDKKLEFTTCNLPFLKNNSFIFDKNEEGLLINGMDKKVLIKIFPKQVIELIKIENLITKKLSSLYKDIILGREKLICLEMGIEDYPYLITAKTILEAKIYSPKYIKALEFAFSDKCLKRYQIGIYPNFKNYDDMQERLGKAVISLGLEPNDTYNGEKVIKTTLRELLEGVM